MHSFVCLSVCPSLSLVFTISTMYDITKTEEAAKKSG